MAVTTRWLTMLVSAVLASAVLAQQPAAAQDQTAWLPQVQRGFAAQSAKQWEGAVTAYTAAIESGKVPAEHQLSVATNLGLALQNVDRLDEALSWFDKVLAVHPSNVDAHHNRGNVLYRQQRYAEAIAAFGRAVELVPTDAESLFNQGNAASKMGDHSAAADAFGAVLKLTPRDQQASYNRANALSTLGRTEEVLLHLYVCIYILYVPMYTHICIYRVNPFLVFARNASVSLHVSPPQAIGAYELTLSIDSTHGPAYANLGIALSSAGRHDAAVQALQVATWPL